jgi:hypothetical protein
MYSENHSEEIKYYLIDKFRSNKYPLYHKFLKIDSCLPYGKAKLFYHFYEYSKDQEVRFVYHEDEIKLIDIKCDIEDKMKDIVNIFISKVNKEPTNFSFELYYKGKIEMEDLEKTYIQFFGYYDDDDSIIPKIDVFEKNDL